MTDPEISWLVEHERASLPLLQLIAGQSGKGIIEVRSLKPGTPNRIFYYPTDRLETCGWRMAQEAHREHRTVYLGAALRARRAGTAADVLETWVLWADCDTAESRERLAAFKHPPTMTVRSGSGDNLHAWWALTEPISAGEITPALQRLASHLHADRKCAELARVMRAPGTLNFKTDPPSRVMMMSHDPFFAVYAAADLLMCLPDLPPRTPRRDTGQVSSTDRLKQIPSSAYYRRLTGYEPDTGLVRCPFWEHKSNPAMRLNDDGSWHCYACGDYGDHGDVYDFAARLWNVTNTSGEDFKRLRARLADELGVTL